MAMDTQLVGIMPLLQGANITYNVNGQNKPFSVEAGEVNQQRQICQNNDLQIRGKQECMVAQKVLDIRQVQKVNANIGLPKFKFTQEEVVALKFLEMQFEEEPAAVPTEQECKKFIRENKAALFMFSKLGIDQEHAYGYDNVPYIEYSHETGCMALSNTTVQIYFLKNKAGNIICKHPSIYSVCGVYEELSNISNRAFDRFCMGEFYEARLKFFGAVAAFKEWACRVADSGISSFVQKELLSILRSRSKSVDAFASFLIHRLDFYNLDAKSIYTRVSYNQSLTRQDQKAIMQYAQTVRLE